MYVRFTSELEKKFKEEIKSYVFSYDNLENDFEITTLENLALIYGFRVEHTDTDDVTHLVVKTHTDGCFRRTSKTGSALVAHRPIINFKWVLDCLKKESFLSEVCTCFILSNYVTDLIYCNIFLAWLYAS